MGFDQLLGNEQLKENLRSAAQKGRLSHFYLISGPEGSGKHTLARLLSAALLCGGNHRENGYQIGNIPGGKGRHPGVQLIEDFHNCLIALGGFGIQTLYG